MVQVTEDGLNINMKTASAAEDWVNIVHELIGLLQSENALQENGDGPDKSRYLTLELLREMMPTWEQLKRLDK